MRFREKLEPTDPRLVELAIEVLALERQRSPEWRSVELRCGHALRLVFEEGLAIDPRLYGYFEDVDIRRKDAAYLRYQHEVVTTITGPSGFPTMGV